MKPPVTLANRRQYIAESLRQFTAGVIAAILVAYLYGLLLPFVVLPFGRWINRYAEAYSGRLVLVSLIFLGASILSVFKQRRQGYYGVVEMAFGLFLGWLVLGEIANSIQAQHVAGLIGAGYVVTEGMTNVGEALNNKDQREHHYAYEGSTEPIIQ